MVRMNPDKKGIGKGTIDTYRPPTFAVNGAPVQINSGKENKMLYV